MNWELINRLRRTAGGRPEGLRSHYDFVYLTNTPSFYKLKLCDAITRRGASVLIVFYGYGSEAVNTVLTGDDTFGFDYTFLHTGDASRRGHWRTFWRLTRLLSGVSWRRLLFSGWLAPEYNIACFLTPRGRNAVVCESTVWDISLRGLQGAVKRAIIGRMSAALPSGQPHREFFESIGFAGRLEVTGSVGIFNKGPRRAKAAHDGPRRYIYVGRLIDVKGVDLLIDVFNALGKPLTIVGAGPLEKELRARARGNITFTGFIDNEALGEVYQAHDVFILPSRYEPWGLVVEEAIYWGLPVIVSDRVGSSTDMVRDLGTGVVFASGSARSLTEAIDAVERGYEGYRAAAEAVDWNARDAAQVDAYMALLD